MIIKQEIHYIPENKILYVCVEERKGNDLHNGDTHG